MAFPRLALRGVMWGADKIPDEWFDKVPGGFFKGNDNQGKTKKTSQQNKPGSHHRHSSRSRDDDRPPHRSSRDRRHSSHDGYQSDDAYARHRNTRRSYDGAEEDRMNDRERRRKSTAEAGAHDSVLDDKPSDRRRRRDSHQSHHVHMYPGSYAPGEKGAGANNYSPGGYAAAGAAGGAAMGATAAADTAGYSGSYGSPDPSFIQSPPPGSATFATPYVPYSNIYGQPPAPSQPHPAPRQHQQQPYSYSTPPPPPSSDSSLKPSAKNQLSPPVAPQEGYHQNPYAQDAPYGSQPSYMPDPHMYSAQREGAENPRAGDFADDYDSRFPSRSPPRRSSRRYRSPSEFSGDSYRDTRRTRSERRDPSSRAPADQKKGVPFTKSKKGLAYGAAGALYGGLLGTEVGGGPLAPVIGAAVGALGANAFQAHEKRKDDESLAKRNSRMQPVARRDDDDNNRRYYDRYNDRNPNDRYDDRPRYPDDAAYRRRSRYDNDNEDYDYDYDGVYDRRPARQTNGFHSD